MNGRQIIIKFEAYLLTEQRVSNNTFLSYKKDLSQLITFFEKNNIELLQCNSDQVKQFVHYLHGLKLSARSIARKISALKTFFNYLSKHFSLKNHGKELIIPKVEKKLPTYLTQDEVTALLTESEKDTTELGIRNSLMMYLLYASGIRVTELITIKITDIHFDTRFLMIQGKGGRQRMIPLPQSIITRISDYIQRYSDSKALYLFPIKYGKKIKPISRQSCWNILKKLCAQAGIKRAISPHQLRHSFATHMLAKGADLRSLQMLLGHEEITTVEVYTHVEMSQLRHVYDKKHPRS